MGKVQWKGGTMLSPLPAVLVSCGTMDESNLITIAWTGIVNSVPPKTYVSIRPDRFSYDIIKKNRQFVINTVTPAMVRSLDFCGVASGRDVDKFAKCRLNKLSGSTVSCPLVAESPVSLECHVTDIIPLGSHSMFLADIKAVQVDESLIDESGKLHLAKAGLVSYTHGEYFAQGKRLGKFGFAVKKKR